MNGKPKSKLDIGSKQGTVDGNSGMTRRLSMKIAKIKNVFPEKNTVDVEWLWPQRGGANGISIGRPFVGFRSGIHFVPEVGSIVLMGYAFNQMVMLSYLLPSDYKNLVTNMKDTKGNPSRIRQMQIGEISLNSIQNSEIYIHDKIEIQDKNLDRIVIDPQDGSILLNCILLKVENEAGKINMGPVFRFIDGSLSPVTNDGKEILSTNGGNALTEMKIEINEFADGTLFGAQSNSKIAEVTLGTLVNASGKKVLNQAGNEIVCDIQLSSGAKVQIDKKGNININEGNMKKPLDVSVTPPSDLTQPSSVKYSNMSQQRAAREGDKVIIPLTTAIPPNTLTHPGLTSKSSKNATTMSQLASLFISPVGVVGGPCKFAPVPGMVLVAEIVSGANGVYIGSLDKVAEQDELKQ